MFVQILITPAPVCVPGRAVIYLGQSFTTLTPDLIPGPVEL